MKVSFESREESPMDIHRKGECGPIPDRKSRFFKHGEHWFYTTRECSIIGPYETFQHALYGCRKFLAQVKAINEYHQGKEYHQNKDYRRQENACA